MKTFNVPVFYRSPLITRVKQIRKLNDPRKKDITPFEVDFGPVKFLLARHFGFCYGVENAIEIAFRALDENPGRRIFLLSEMIHNPLVNRDLNERGVQFLQDTMGHQLIPFENLQRDDVVVIPAFGAPLQLLERLEKGGIITHMYNTTCPFVERVWKKSEQIGKNGHTIVIHGKYSHEETRSTFSRSERDSEAVVVVRDMDETKKLAEYIHQRKTQAQFETEFKGKHSPGFDISVHFNRLGVINQTTMLATETQEIADYLFQQMRHRFGEQSVKEHFADTRDTLCYATNENQDAVNGMLMAEAQLAIVVGGYNSSNTSHLVELCEKKFPTYFISSASEIENQNTINHFHYPTKTRLSTSAYLPAGQTTRILLTSGASCPDSLLEEVMKKIASFYPQALKAEEVLQKLEAAAAN